MSLESLLASFPNKEKVWLLKIFLEDSVRYNKTLKMEIETIESLKKEMTEIK